MLLLSPVVEGEDGETLQLAGLTAVARPTKTFVGGGYACFKMVFSTAVATVTVASRPRADCDGYAPMVWRIYVVRCLVEPGTYPLSLVSSAARPLYTETGVVDCSLHAALECAVRVGDRRNTRGVPGRPVCRGEGSSGGGDSGSDARHRRRKR